MANKKRLIDANALIEEANAEGAYGYVDAFQIANAPTVDAVEVVRCKDCKYQGYCMRRIPFFGRNLILELNIAEYHPLGFCSYGDRRTDV